MPHKSATYEENGHFSHRTVHVVKAEKKLNGGGQLSSYYHIWYGLVLSPFMTTEEK